MESCVHEKRGNKLKLLQGLGTAGYLGYLGSAQKHPTAKPGLLLVRLGQLFISSGGKEGPSTAIPVPQEWPESKTWVVGWVEASPDLSTRTLWGQCVHLKNNLNKPLILWVCGSPFEEMLDFPVLGSPKRISVGCSDMGSAHTGMKSHIPDRGNVIPIQTSFHCKPNPRASRARCLPDPLMEYF